VDGTTKWTASDDWFYSIDERDNHQSASKEQLDLFLNETIKEHEELLRKLKD
jgi:hypothetical protein